MDLAGVREERREERETLQKMRENGLKTFYIRRWTGWVLTRSSAPRCGPFDLDPNGSGSIQRPRGVLEIRIHPPAWVWAGYPRFFCFSFQFLTFLLCAPLCLLFGPPVRFDFFTKFQKKIAMRSWYVFYCFAMFSHIQD